MDLLQTVRKEGSRGGVNFSWDDVKSSQHRENYLGHSLMAPVGRWQKNKDLNWYAKADEAELTPEERAEREAERKREELRKIKEAEEDAMNRALGLPVPDRTNANNEPLGQTKITQKVVDAALKEALAGEEEGGGETDRALGLGDKGKDRRSPRKEDRRRARGDDRRHYRDDDRPSKRTRRSRSRSRDRDKERRHRHRHTHRERSKSGSRDRHRHRRYRSRSRDRDYDTSRKKRIHDERPRSRERERNRHYSRSRSPREDWRRRREDR